MLTHANIVSYSQKPQISSYPTHGTKAYWKESKRKKYHSFSDISQDNDACVHVISLIVVFCGLAHFKLYMRVHLKCFVYLYVWGYPGAGSKKDMYKHIIQFDFYQNPTIEQKTAHVCNPVAASTHTYTLPPSSLFM